MQTVYIIRENEEDGVLLDALLARGVDPDQVEGCNPTCPRCFSTTLLAFSEGDAYDVLTWFTLNEEDVAGADHWYLVCSNLECEWEEEVERVTNPFEATTTFDPETSSHWLDEHCNVSSGPPARQLRLIEYFKRLRQFYGTRKLEALQETAEWYYAHEMKQIRAWFERVPTGRTVEIRTGGETVKGTFLTASQNACMVMQENGELITVDAHTIYTFYPRRFDQWGPEEQAVQRTAKQSGLKRLDATPDSLTIICGWSQRIVVRGYELEFEWVDRFGRYLGYTQDPHAAEALGLTSTGYQWEGTFRRSEIEARYDVTEMLKVKGYWVELSGYTNTNQLPEVMTEDPDAARALGLKLQKPLILDADEEPTLDQTTPRWYGVVQPDDVEERSEVKTWHWPLPEVQVD
ncbi:MAG TPA: hypothetical protein VK464_07350 [Symbiobacteriaceae bacterium]|jgi:hypothetical protein|nr:hypothetical protein [Symbiobacteriaceae bacterium]